MTEEVIFELKALYRDNMRIRGFRFGNGEKSVCIVGATRGNEIQQIYTCSQIVKALKVLEAKNYIADGKSIMVIPTVNAYSMNIKKRFWCTDNTDINRMFPGYDKGETTQRIAAGVFKEVQDYEYGIQFASFYIPGSFIPHVRMMKTGYECTELAKKFGLPYVLVRDTKPYDTTTLNYNWQIWNTKAFSIYAHKTDDIEEKSTREAVTAVLRFLNAIGVIKYAAPPGYNSETVCEGDLMTVRSHTAGIFLPKSGVNRHVAQGDLLAEIIDPCTGEVSEYIHAEKSGIVFFRNVDHLIYSNAAMFKLILNHETEI